MKIIINVYICSIYAQLNFFCCEIVLVVVVDLSVSKHTCLKEKKRCGCHLLVVLIDVRCNCNCNWYTITCFTETLITITFGCIGGLSHQKIQSISCKQNIFWLSKVWKNKIQLAYHLAWLGIYLDHTITMMFACCKIEDFVVDWEIPPYSNDIFGCSYIQLELMDWLSTLRVISKHWCCHCFGCLSVQPLPQLKWSWHIVKIKIEQQLCCQPIWWTFSLWWFLFSFWWLSNTAVWYLRRKASV